MLSRTENVEIKHTSRGTKESMPNSELTSTLSIKLNNVETKIFNLSPRFTEIPLMKERHGVERIDILFSLPWMEHLRTLLSYTHKFVDRVLFGSHLQFIDNDNTREKLILL